ncbi:hypothetical protein TSAR_009409 [Trichomalopsis sarcophagae]|uniref:Retrotransposon gag domain-containing protein n=1 Tax=Trichomalopsis sarcophagae TaxID=543379 RepID=A0A232EIK5_9HYME|nr:hypothetical protein TSAR_009409 [Trichomalopsis sarcophagae]
MKFISVILQRYTYLLAGLTLGLRISRNEEQLTTVVRRGGRVIRDANPTIIKAELPTFSTAACDRPMHFLSSLSKYLEIVDPSGINYKFIISQAMKGPALDWLKHIEARVDSVNKFRERFTSRYWNSSIQAAFRRELEFGFGICYSAVQ